MIKDASIGSNDEEEEEEERPLTIADIRALLDEQEERINAAHQEEIRTYKEEIRLLEEETDRRFKDLERASFFSPPKQDEANAIFINSPPRRGNTAARLFFLLLPQRRNEGSSGDGEGYGSSEGLEEDTFSIMMLNEPIREIPYCHPILLSIICILGLFGFVFLTADLLSKTLNSLFFHNIILFWSLVAVFGIMLFGPLSSPWLLSMFTFCYLQFTVASWIIADQTLLQSWALGCNHDAACDPFHVPLGTHTGITLAQYGAIFFALAMQNDIFSSLRTLRKLLNADNVPWDEVIRQKGNRTWRLWVCRIFLPNILKFIQAVMTLFATFVVIVQSMRIVDLLKDFTALLIVSQADNIMFHVANLGYFGENLAKKTEEVLSVRWVVIEEEREEGGTDEDEEKEEGLYPPWCSFRMGNCFFFTLYYMVMSGALTYFVVGQYNGRYMNMKYPECKVPHPSWVGNRNCHDFPPYNTAECSWDGGDCPEPTVVKGYINCTVSFSTKIGDGECNDVPPYNTEECGFDGMDCIYD